MKASITAILTWLFLCTGYCLSADDCWPLPEWAKARPSGVGMDEAKLAND